MKKIEDSRLPLLPTANSPLDKFESNTFKVMLAFLHQSEEIQERR